MAIRNRPVKPGANADAVMVRGSYDGSTRKATKFRDQYGKTHLIPDSQIRNLDMLGGDMVVGRSITLLIPRWLAKKIGLA